jgi:hypothetical protein
LSWIRIHDPSIRENEDSSYLTPHGYRDRLQLSLRTFIFSNILFPNIFNQSNNAAKQRNKKTYHVKFLAHTRIKMKYV